ncbi:hypothetical protein LguiB_027909 [Lonicera macranthoides]
MEGSIVAVEENHQRADSTNAASNSLGSLVKIDSIYIDLGIPMEKKNDAPGNKCQHFSIRGYVAEMREKDKSKCTPFSLFGKDSNLEEALPPMLVTKFRSWECENCLQEIGAVIASGEIGVVSKCCERGVISSTSYSRMPSNGSAEQSRLNQAFAPENCERRESELNISANLNRLENYFSSCSDEKGKNAEVGDMDVNGHDNGLEDNANQELGNRTYELQLLQQYLVNEKRTDSAVPVQSKSSRSVETSEPNPGLRDAAGVLPAIKYPKSKAEGKFFQKTNSSGGEQRNGLVNCEMSVKGCKIDEEENVDKGKRIRLPLEVEELVKPSSESYEIMGRDRNHSQHPKSPTSLQRKGQKMRLLAELLGSRENLENENRKTGGGCSNAVPNVSNGLASISANQDELSLDGSTGNGSSGPQKKRKIEESTKAMDSTCLKFFGKKARTLKADEDLTKTAIEISGSEMEGNAPVGTKSKLKKHGIDRNSNLGQKKNRQAQVGDGCLQLGSWKDAIPKVHNKIKDAKKSGATVADPFRSRGMESYFKGYLSPQHTEKESSSSSKKKNKISQVEDGQAFSVLPSRSAFEEGAIKRNDIRFLQNGSEIVKSWPRNDVCDKMGLDLSLNSCMSAERNEQSHIAQVADKSGFLFPQPKAIQSKDLKRKDRMFVGESSVSRKSAPDPFMRERLHYDLSDRIAHRTDILHEKQNCSPLLEDGSFSMHPNLDLSGPSNSKRSSEGRGHLETIMTHSDQRAGKVFEQGNSDEIPMEIVELMAKNQYERGLCEADKNYRLSGRANNNKTNNAEMMGFSNVHGNGVMRILPKEYPSMRKPPPTNSTSAILQKYENVGPAKQNHVNFFPSDHRNHFNMGPQEENPRFKMFDSFSPSIQFQNRLHDKTEQFWPFKPNLLEDGPTQEADKVMRAQIHEKNRGKTIRDFDLNRVASNTSILENPNNTPHSEPYKGTSLACHQSVKEQRETDRNAEMMGSFDSFSNEAIPAMQLLSLMHAGLKTTKPLDVDTKRVLEKPFFPCGNHPNFSMDKPLFPCNYNSKGFSGLGSSIVYKSGESLRNPSSFSLYGKNQTLESICECASPAAADPFVSLLQRDQNQKRPVGSENLIFFQSREQERERRSYLPPQNKGRKSPKSDAPHKVLEFNTSRDKQKGVVGPSKSRLFKDLTKSIDLEGSYRHGTVRPLKITSRSEMCTLNRNPAEFSVPERGNAYTIGGEDLRFPKRIPSKVKSKNLLH